MKSRLISRSSLRSASRSLPCAAPSRYRVPITSARSASSVSQQPGSDYVSFPGAVKSAFTSQLKFTLPSDHPTVPTYRVVDQDGNIVDHSFKQDLSDEDVLELYKKMLTISIMDVIMFDAQRQGRLSFYMVSAGEEALSVGSASILDKQDVIFCQYREQGVFAQRGYTLNEFMNQLFANKLDSGRGRNMPVHYGSKELNIVSQPGTSLYARPYILTMY